MKMIMIVADAARRDAAGDRITRLFMLPVERQA